MSGEGEPVSLSVVVPAVRGARLLRECLQSLASQTAPEKIEVLVVTRLPAGEAEGIAAEFPETRALRADGLTIPQMRARGIVEARAPIVAVLAEHVRAAPTWAGAMLRGHAAGGPSVGAVGGSVAALKRGGAAARAAFLAEYSDHMPPLPEGPALSLPGINVSYKRTAIESFGELFHEGVWETILHDALAANGFGLRYEKGAEVFVTRDYRAAAFLAEKFQIARSYAGMRAKRISAAARIARATAAVLLPILLLFRIGRNGRRAFEVPAPLASLPFLFLFLAAWTLGEWTGYVLGEGRSTWKVA